MAVLEGVRSPDERRRDRVKPKLSLLDPVTNGVLADLPLEADYYHETRAFAKELVRARNMWDVERRRGGLFGPGFIRPADADAALKRALADLSAGGDA